MLCENDKTLEYHCFAVCAHNLGGIKMHFSEQNSSTDCLCHQYDNFSSLNGSYSASVGQLNLSHSHIQFLFIFLLSCHEFFISHLMRPLMCLLYKAQ